MVHKDESLNIGVGEALGVFLAHRRQQRTEVMDFTSATDQATTQTRQALENILDTTDPDQLAAALLVVSLLYRTIREDEASVAASKIGLVQLSLAQTLLTLTGQWPDRYS